MPTPLVTVITAHAGTPLLKRCIESVRDQGYENIQHLVVADGPPRGRMLARCWTRSRTIGSA